MTYGRDMNQNMEDNISANIEVARVSVKTPPFWKEDPTMWFAQIESQFVTAGITRDETKFHMLVGSIETNILSQVSDIISSPPSGRMYETLKNKILEIFAESQEQKFNRLLQGLELGDRRPSELLREMTKLAGTQVSECMIRFLWLRRLPANVQMLLVTSNDPLRELATKADKIFEVMPSPNIHTCDKSNEDSQNHVINQMRESIQELKTELSALSARSSLYDSRLQFRKQRNVRQPRRTRFCWYHENFGKNAYRCVAPCDFRYSGNDQARR